MSWHAASVKAKTPEAMADQPEPQPPDAPPLVNQAHPTRCPQGPVARSPRASRRRMYSYTHAESQAIWAEAQSYREAPR